MIQVHGAPRTPQTQRLGERTNWRVKDNLTNILKEIQANLSSWYIRNINFHRAVKETLNQLAFGIDTKKEIQMKVPVEEYQQSETANKIEGRK